MKYHVLLLGLLCTTVGQVQAESVYKIEKNGVTVYTNVSTPGAHKIALPDISVVSAAQPTINNVQPQLPSVPGLSNVPPNGNLTGLLPPPPPALKELPPKSTVPTSSPANKKVEDVEGLLLKARSELEEQSSIRNGDEKNYQKKLDRLKPLEEAVTKYEAQLKELQKK